MRNNNTEYVDPVTGLRMRSKIVSILSNPGTGPGMGNHVSKEILVSNMPPAYRLGPDGIMQLFPDKAGGLEWYQPDNINFVTSSNPIITDNKYYNFEAGKNIEYI